MMNVCSKLIKTAFFTTYTLLVLCINACGQEADSSVQVKKNNTLVKTEEQWKKQLSSEQYYVLREEGTEAAFSGKLLMNKEKGVYKCGGCGNPLFTDDMKFDSHCGWPSFDKEISGGKIVMHEDNKFGMNRTEIECAKCGGHLGHLFDDGPTETGLRYCVNSASLEFVSEKDASVQKAKGGQKMDTITLGGGCYWCVEAVYEMLEGVVKVESGFSGGNTKNPSYEEVCSGKTGHAEVVQLVYEESKISLEEILKVFFTVHDPTTLNRQGADVGTQYRSVIFYRNENERIIVKDIVDELNLEKVYDSPIVTQITAFKRFYSAEKYHQDYYKLNKEEQYCKLVIQPKIEKFEKVFRNKLKK
jgi:peptide methionine sulfoxide reductase msrA/msrB